MNPLLLQRLTVASAVLTSIGCERPSPAPDPNPSARPVSVKPAWQWSMDTVRTVVNAVRAGRTLQPASWPAGARVAVLLSFDVDNETVSLRFGEPTIGALSEGQYGARVGLKRVVDLMDRKGVPGTFFFPSVSLSLAPEMAETIKRSGRHEFGVHGWIHEMNVGIPPAKERELVTRAVDELTRLTGTRPVGYRAPSWNLSAATLGIVRELGFLYESSLMADESPYELLADGKPTGMIELPVEWILDDAPLVLPTGPRYSTPRDLLQVWIDEFDRAYQERTMFLLTMHPHIIGHRSRILVLKTLIDYIQTKPQVWFATHRDVAEYVREVSGLGRPTGAAPSGN